MPTLTRFVFVSSSSPNCKKTVQLRSFFEQFKITAREVKQGKTEAGRLQKRARKILGKKCSTDFPLVFVFWSGDTKRGVLWVRDQPSELELLKAVKVVGNYA